MRVNALTRNCEQECNRYAIPYRVVGGFKFFERKEIKDVLSYLKLISNHYDNEAFARAIAFPKRGIGQTTVDKVIALSQEYGVSAIQLIADERNLESLGASSRKKLAEFSKLYQELKELSQNNNLSDFFHLMLDILDVRTIFSTIDEEDRLLNIDELEQSVIDFCHENSSATLSDYLQTSALSQEREDGKEKDAITISTIHGVKGLEFKAVFVVGLEDGLFPSSRAFSLNEIQEERRLMYVAVTRAKQRLFLTHAKSRFCYGMRGETKQSSFFKDAYSIIHPTAANRAYGTPTGGYGAQNYAYKQNFERDDYGVKYGYGANPSSFSRPSQPTQQKATVSLSAGQRVRHATFGEGMVLMVSGGIAEVVFASVGKKKLNVQFAPSTKIE